MTKLTIDYYGMAHHTVEKITAQPCLLVGGTPKEYQLKGLQSHDLNPCIDIFAY